MSIKDTNCNHCVNRCTGICETCTYIESAKGDSIPTAYCGMDDYTASLVMLEDLKALIQNRIEHCRLIDLRFVIEYNKRMEDKIYGKKTDISTS